jgi:peptidoglycan/LPS O-acetylase OafA/YrhL
VLPRLRQKAIPGLDGVRAVAVALVMAYHFGFVAVPGGQGVLIFFVLSGFLITWLLLGEVERTGDVSLRGFYFRRALRILPAFYAFLIFALALLVVTGRHVFWEQVAYAVAYVANYYGATHDEAHSNGILGHIWSLAIEEQFYVLWPVALWHLRHRRELLTRTLVAAIAGIWIYRCALALGGVSTRYIYHALDTRADHLLIGCLVAVVIKRGLHKGFWETVTRASWMPFATAMLFAASSLYGHQHMLYRHTIGYAIEPVLAAIGIIQIVALSATPAWRWMEWQPVVWTGRISYSLYLYQQLGVSRFVLPARSMPIRLVACVAVTFFLASASYYIVERPFLRLKDRRGVLAPSAAPGRLAA